MQPLDRIQPTQPLQPHEPLQPQLQPPLPTQQFPLTGLSIPQNNPYKKMSRPQLLSTLFKLQTTNKQLTARLAFLQPQKQKSPICGTSAKRTKLFQQYQLRKYCLRIAYIGITYNGFIIQSSTDNTVEHFLFKSLYACNLIRDEEPGEDYTRAGRTDRGVSAFGNVIALNLRTSIPKSVIGEDQVSTLDYCRMINANLPSDIRILSCQPVSPDFNARYWCTQRSYKYFFLKSFLDLQRMSQAIQYFEGTHNFINFCRIDVVATTNHERTIKKSRIERFQEFSGDNGDFRNEIYYFHFVGNAFLWHQIRFMVTILFMVGSHKEEPVIVKQLLDTGLFPRKPNYPISPEYPLILEDCKYEQHEFEVKKEDVLEFYNCFVEVMMRRMIDLNLYVSCMANVQSTMWKDLKIGKEELTKLCVEEERKVFKTKAKKKLSLQNTSCINVKEAIDKLTGKRLGLYEKRMEKQAAYEERERVKLERRQDDMNQ